jgi:hypothetical protein
MFRLAACSFSLFKIRHSIASNSFFVASNFVVKNSLLLHFQSNDLCYLPPKSLPSIGILDKGLEFDEV